MQAYEDNYDHVQHAVGHYFELNCDVMEVGNTLIYLWYKSREGGISKNVNHGQRSLEKASSKNKTTFHKTWKLE